MPEPPLYALPADLPIPEDDGACDHLPGLRLPSVPPRSTSGRLVDLAGSQTITVVYVYPHTGRPDVPTPEEWDLIPGARGCTPQSCAFRDHFAEPQDLRAAVFGVSTDPPEWQREAHERLHLPFELISDADETWAKALRLPTFEFRGRIHLRRITFVLDDGYISKVFYPVFPPDRNAAEVVAYLRHPETQR